MAKNILINGQLRPGVSEVELPTSDGTAVFRDEDEVASPIRIIEGTFTTTAANEATFTHNLGLDSYIFIWYYEGWEDAVENSTESKWMPVYGISTYGLGAKLIPEELVSNIMLKSGGFMQCKPDTKSWGGPTQPTQIATSTNENKVCWGSGYGNFIGTYHYWIIDTSGLEV